MRDTGASLVARIAVTLLSASEPRRKGEPSRPSLHDGDGPGGLTLPMFCPSMAALGPGRMAFTHRLEPCLHCVLITLGFLLLKSRFQFSSIAMLTAIYSQDAASDRQTTMSPEIAPWARENHARTAETKIADARGSASLVTVLFYCQSFI